MKESEKVPKANANRLITAVRTLPSSGTPRHARLLETAAGTSQKPCIPHAEPRAVTQVLNRSLGSAGATAAPQRARTIKTEQPLLIAFGRSYPGEGIFQLKHMNRNAKIQICRQGVCYSKLMNICFLNSQVHKNIFMHFITIIKPNVADFRAC